MSQMSCGVASLFHGSIANGSHALGMLGRRGAAAAGWHLVGAGSRGAIVRPLTPDACRNSDIEFKGSEHTACITGDGLEKQRRAIRVFAPLRRHVRPRTHHQAAEKQRGSAASSGALHEWLDGTWAVFAGVAAAAGQMPVWWAWS